MAVKGKHVRKRCDQDCKTKGKMKKLLPVIFPYPDFSFSINTL